MVEESQTIAITTQEEVDSHINEQIKLDDTHYASLIVSVSRYQSEIYFEKKKNFSEIINHCD